ncbi:MATE family efflux transporter [uncultured Bacteroides sp.]|uniref:MATE family efflux transporter n=1 Tax=uncultured Bacteroides sp. TaxID=162156 RepID=UPI00262FB20E|nr:MATE family efflux transporter [uncultured Bacteroides sp.]
MKETDKQILNIALPAIVSNITVPLLGLVDVTIVGHLGNAAYIGAIAVGGMLFNIIYWIFAFLRMGTSGMTAQLFGKHLTGEMAQMVVRSVGIGMMAAFALIILQIPIKEAAFLFIHPTEEIKGLATTYFHICIWGAPATLGLYGLTGWYIGMQNSHIPMTIAITQNVVNIIASLCLVYIGGLKVEGIALGTLIAQYAGFLMGIGLWIRHYGGLWKFFSRKGLWEQQAMWHFFQINRDIFLRTLCLVAVTLFFTSSGAEQGEIILAVNTLLMQLFTLYSYIMDGFAYAGEALIGKHIGAQNYPAYTCTRKHLFAWGGIMALLFTIAYATGGNAFLTLLTDETEVIEASGNYLGWALIIPIAGMAAFIWDGIYIGATNTRGMLQSMAVATGCFFLLYYTLHRTWGNHALWLAFLAYLSVRGFMQTFLSRQMTHQAFPSH